MNATGRTATAAMALLFAAGAPGTTPARAGEGGEDAPAAEVTAEARDEAIRAAIGYLDDALGKLQDGGSPQKPYAVATTAWAGILLAARRGGPRIPPRDLERLRDSCERFVKTVARASGRADDNRDDPRRPPPGAGPAGPGGMMPMGRPGEATQFVWPLSVTTHFLAECAARGWKAGDAKALLRQAVEVFEASQQPGGGWGHDDASRPGMGLPPIRIPKPWGGGELDYPGTLLAASNGALSALGTAHRVLGTRKAPSLEKGRKYFADAQNGDGTFPYDPSQRHGEGATVAGEFRAIEVARTAGALFALGCAGARSDDPVLAKAAAALEGKTRDLSEGHGSATLALQYAALVCRQRGEGAWKEFRAEFFPRILAAREEDGSFRCVCRQSSAGVTCDSKALPIPGADSFTAGGKVYVTAVHLLVLALDEVAPKAPPPIEVRPPQATPR